MWKLGPVIKEVYSEYRKVGYGHISKPTEYLSFENGKAIFLTHESADFNDKESNLVDDIINKYGNVDSFSLLIIALKPELEMLT